VTVENESRKASIHMDRNNNSVSLASIVIDKRFQTRAATDQDAIADYTDAIRQKGGWPFPPIKVVSQFLVDGFHRVEAAKRVADDPETPAELRKSLQSVPCERVAVDLTRDDVPDLALQHALAANHKHGLRRSNADKRHAVELALNRWPDMSDREIAKITGTSHPSVGRVRGELTLETLPLESESASEPNHPGGPETIPSKLEAVSAPEDPGEVENLPPEVEPESVRDDLRQVENLPPAKQRDGGDGKKLESRIKKAKGEEKPSAAKMFVIMQQQHFSGHNGLPQTIDRMAEANGGQGAKFKDAHASLNSFLAATKLMRDGAL
jgi:hypothetical protein